LSDSMLESASIGSKISGAANVYADRISVDIICTSANNRTILFNVRNAVGSYNLSLSLSGGDSQTITMFIPADNLNVILSEGCFEVVTVDTDNVVMRFDVKEDDNVISGEISLEVR